MQPFTVQGLGFKVNPKQHWGNHVETPISLKAGSRRIPIYARVLLDERSLESAGIRLNFNILSRSPNEP